jgi:hypothetical protein
MPSSPDGKGLTPLDDPTSILSTQAMGLAPLTQSPPNSNHPQTQVAANSAVNMPNRIPLATIQKFSQTPAPKADENFDPSSVDICNTVYLKAMKRKLLNQLLFECWGE